MTFDPFIIAAILLIIYALIWLGADLSITVANVAPGTPIQYGRAIAGVNLTAGQTVYADASGNLQLAKADTLAHAACVGITMHAALANQPCTYAMNGNVVVGATLTVGQWYVVSGAVAGNIAPLADLTTGNYGTLLGYASSTTNLVLSIVQTGVAHG